VRDIDRNMQRIDQLEQSVHAQEVLLARIAGDMSAIRESVQRIDERGSKK